MPYETLLVVALLLIAAFPLAGAGNLTRRGTPHFLVQTYFLCVVATYFSWFWHHGGQTLAMKTWRIRVTDANGKSITIGRALARFACAALFFVPAAVGVVLLLFPNRISPLIAMWLLLPPVATILWVPFDPDRQFLHDRMAGTRLVADK